MTKTPPWIFLTSQMPSQHLQQWFWFYRYMLHIKLGPTMIKNHSKLSSPRPSCCLWEEESNPQAKSSRMFSSSINYRWLLAVQMSTHMQFLDSHCISTFLVGGYIQFLKKKIVVHIFFVLVMICLCLWWWLGRGRKYEYCDICLFHADFAPKRS